VIAVIGKAKALPRRTQRNTEEVLKSAILGKSGDPAIPQTPSVSSVASVVKGLA
jgi:hypothetical protein